MKCVWALMLLMACLSQTLLALPTSTDSNQENTNESLDKMPLLQSANTNQETKEVEEAVTSLPNDDESKESETTEISETASEVDVVDEELEEDEEEEEEVESKRAARGLVLGTYGKQTKYHRPGPKSKSSRPRKGHIMPHQKYGPPPPTHHRPATKYGPPNYRGYNPENKIVKMPTRPAYDDKMMMMMIREKLNRAKMPQRPLMHPKVVYGGPVPIPFGPSDAFYQTPVITSEVKLPPHLMYQSPPTLPSQLFREEPKEPMNHLSYPEAVIPVTEPSVEIMESSMPPLMTVTPQTLPEVYTDISNFKFVPDESSSTELKSVNNLHLNDFETVDALDIHKPGYEYPMPMNYFGLAYPSENARYGGKYKFGYRVADHESGNDFGHEEEREGELTDGRYHVLLPDGRVQNVNYHADHSGYYADVSYKKGQREQLNRERELLNRERDLQFEKEREKLYAPYQS